VGLSAFVGAGVVAFGAASELPDAKAVNPTILAGLENAALGADQLAERAEDQRANRAEDRGEPKTPVEVAPEDLWKLPLDNYTFTSPYGVRFDKLHAGVDLAAEEGTPYKAIHAGVVTKAGYEGGYGYAVTVRQPDGTEIIYGHSKKLLVQEGQEVKAGDTLGLVGSTGWSYGNHLHVEVHVDGQPTDPIPHLRKHGVDVKLGVESIYSNAS
jgi:murein DD-endopeptidase MepM/ murein hydrolase activator NlpD